MTGPYYYLVASLPVLPPLGKDTGIKTDKIIENIRLNLSGGDQNIFTWLLYPNDIKVWVNQLAKARNLPEPHPFVFPVTTLPEDFNKSLSRSAEIPGFLQDFLIDFRERVEQMSLREVEMSLLEYFYALTAQSGHPFIKNYFSFDKALKQISAGLNIRSFEIGDHNLLRDELYRTIVSKTIRDFGLSGEFPFMEKLADIFENRNPEQLEKFLDRIRLQYLDELDSLHFFSLENVLAFTLRLFIKKRWEPLQEEAGQNALENLLNEIM